MRFLSGVNGLGASVDVAFLQQQVDARAQAMANSLNVGTAEQKLLARGQSTVQKQQQATLTAQYLETLAELERKKASQQTSKMMLMGGAALAALYFLTRH